MNFMPPFFELLLIASIGIAIHFITRLIEARNKKENIDWVLQGLGMVLSLLISFMLIYTRDSIKDIFPITPFIAGITGYSAQSIFAKLVTMKTKSLEQ